LACLVFLTIVAVIALPEFYFSSEAHRRSRIEAARAESVRILSGAKTPAELKEAVGEWGIVFFIQDRDWIAIRYVDSHGGGIWSSAVARDSGGAWFVSEVHFCGRFQGYRIRKEKSEDLPDELKAIEESKNLDTARERLIGLGFQRVPAPG
jgi:hypothetical protein